MTISEVDEIYGKMNELSKLAWDEFKTFLEKIKNSKSMMAEKKPKQNKESLNISEIKKF